VPITPFHFGPGLLAKGIAPRRVSWSAFAVSNVVIDIESLYYLRQHAAHVHRQLHTFAGAALVGIATTLVLLAIPRAWLARRSPIFRAEGTVGGIAIGAMSGALSHPILDGIMHGDIEPFQPWTAANPLHGLIGLGALHLGCILAGVIGLILVIIRGR
jgi:hypothetical protein